MAKNGSVRRSERRALAKQIFANMFASSSYVGIPSDGQMLWAYEKAGKMLDTIDRFEKTERDAEIAAANPPKPSVDAGDEAEH